MKTKLLKYCSTILPWALTAGLFAPVFHILYKERWDMVDYGHAPFILPIALFIAWTKREELAAIAKQSSPKIYWPGLILLVSSALFFVFGHRWDYMVIQSGSLIPMAFGLVSFLYGPGMARALAFPILYLALLVPPPIGVLDSITLPMRHLASVGAQAILESFQYPVSRQGLLILLGGHEIFMGAPCSGFRSLITMLSLGLIYVYFNKGSLIKNLILILAIVPLAIIGNLARVIVICLITFYWGSEAGQGFLHEFSGIVVFLVMISGLMIIERFLRRTP